MSRARVWKALYLIGATWALALAFSGWAYDVSETVGTNALTFDMADTHNASMTNSPTEFDAGTLVFPELRWMNVLGDRQVFFRGLKVLAQRQDVDITLAEVSHGLDHLGFPLAHSQ